MRNALAIAQNWYGKDHPDTARMMTSLAGTLIYEAHEQEADDLLRPAVATLRRVYANLHPRVAYVVNVMGSLAMDRKNFTSAEADYSLVTTIYRAAFGDQDYRVAVGLGNVATAYLKEKRYQKAEQVFRDVLQRFAKVLPADNINIGITEVKLGRALVLQRRFREAEQHSSAGYQILMKQTSSSTNFVEAARHDLAVLEVALKRP